MKGQRGAWKVTLERSDERVVIVNAKNEKDAIDKAEQAVHDAPASAWTLSEGSVERVVVVDD